MVAGLGVPIFRVFTVNLIKRTKKKKGTKSKSESIARYNSYNPKISLAVKITFLAAKSENKRTFKRCRR